ncbi:MAG TPA: S1C family serine protease [Actinomycetota bacterium]|nr:S1C family serine protease [Actinomycetota bacterium]
MYCTECGRPLVDGGCPVHGLPTPLATAPGPVASHTVPPPGPSLWWGAALALAALLALGGLGLGAFALRSGREAARRADELSGRIDRVASALEEQRDSLEALAARTDRLAQGLERELDAEAIAERARPSVFLIEALGGQGSGFVVSSRPGRSTVLTNLHVVRDAWEAGAAVVLRQDDRTYEGTVTVVSQAEDLALISVPARLPALDLTRREPRVGEEVVVVGAPLGLEHTVVTGVVSGHRERYLQISAPLSPGDSGAPVLAASGQVVGVAVSKIVGVDVEGISFAVPVETICRTVLAC